MREWWANVYADGLGTGALQSLQNASRWECDARAASSVLKRFGWRRAYRVHVRLKPEGAPRRYLDDAERYAWEQAARRGETPRYDWLPTTSHSMLSM